ncbi:MAG: hypothetical protein JSV09_15160 [Thermoplasmata archaeon]|nr:MAG: hypothetical protein JSV09_15160 [Thermoplasmata archaeon]
MKPELVEILKKLAPESTFATDEIAQEFGHEVIRTPPYHPELQSIETCSLVLLGVPSADVAGMAS